MASPASCYSHGAATFFSFPHLVDLVCGSIAAKDILACNLVSRAWHDLFSPHVFRHLALPFGSSQYPWDLIAANTYRVRSASTSQDGDLAYVEKGISFPNLRHFSFRSTEWIVEDFDTAAHESRLRRVFETSPKLATLSLEMNFYLRNQLGLGLLHALGRLSCLVRLHISSTVMEQHIERFLDHCPDSVQELTLGLNQEPDWGVVLDSEVPMTRQRPLRIRRLGIVATVPYMNSILDSLIKLSPCLNHFSYQSHYNENVARIVDILIKHGSRSIERLSIRPQLTYNSQLIRLVHAFPCLRMISSDQLLPLDTDTSTFSALTVIRVDNLGVSLSDVVWIMTLCPLLRELYLGSDWNKRYRHGGISILDLAQSEWVCTQLEVLVLPVTDTVESYREFDWSLTCPLVTRLAQDEVARLVVQFLDKLRGLPNMRQPWIRWSGPGFRMSLETAQAHIVNIWDEDDDISGKQRRKINPEDVEWLGIDWLPQKSLQERVTLGLWCSQAEAQHPGLKYTKMLNDRDEEMLEVCTKYKGRRFFDENLQQPRVVPERPWGDEEDWEPDNRMKADEMEVMVDVYSTDPIRQSHERYYSPNRSNHRRHRAARRSLCSAFRGPTIKRDNDVK
ncbi:hypothetical protein BGW38_001023 [Lunasporangiospora selenospora]|uniref:F-box domain-containing protein n=1 Tax=Lunasporangiospora selenospora TaxID=979761 RepID=A0A9P6FW67_9FUNG|nr:hypothetical protein BGW38_001023 [Lunasporangiospora selenospora]